MCVIPECVSEHGGTSADLPLFVSVLQAQCIHGTDDGSQRLDGVAVNDRLVLLYVVARETVLMDDPKNTQNEHASVNGSVRFGTAFVLRHCDNSPFHTLQTHTSVRTHLT